MKTADASKVWRETAAADGAVRLPRESLPIQPGELLRRIETLEREVNLLKFPLG
jgi:hypothetical protein